METLGEFPLTPTKQLKVGDKVYRDRKRKLVVDYETDDGPYEVVSISPPEQTLNGNPLASIIRTPTASLP